MRAFEWFGGIFETVRYDNLSSAVARVLNGRRRVECDRFVALRSHYMFESVFCLPGKRGTHEKGGVANEVGRFRRRHLVPVPRVAVLLSSTRAWRRRAERSWIARSSGVGRRSDKRSSESAGCSVICRVLPNARRWRSRRASTPRRWSRCAHTATRCRRASLAAACLPGST